MKLALFDIDKTLVDRKHADTGKFHGAIEKVYGVRGKRIATHGMTDQQIIIEILKKEKFSEDAIMEKIETCKREMIKYYKQNIKTFDYIVYDGVMELLLALKRNKVPTGLVTGNLQEIAYLKLNKVKLGKFFSFGGFGSDAIARPDIIKIAIRRAEEKFNSKFDHVFVFGDSPRDIEAGKAAGAKTVAVTTGVYSAAQLKNSRPDYILKNLKDTKKVLDIVLGRVQN